MKKFNQDTKVVHAFLPEDLAGGANVGDYVDMGLYDSLTLLYASAAGTASQDVTIKLRQAKDNAGTSVKDITGIDWYASQHATAPPEAKTKSNADSFEDDGETACMLQAEITADQLDVSGEFKYVSVTTSDPGANTKLGMAFYVLRGGRYALAVEDQPAVSA